MRMADADTETTEPEDAGSESDTGGENTELVAEVAAVDEALASDVKELHDRVAELESEVAERAEEVETMKSRLTRAKADFQNYKKRAKKREEAIKERAAEDLINRVLDVRDNLLRALEQDDDVDIRDGVEATLATFDRVLDAENVDTIEPQPGDEVDPARHEVVMRVSGEQPAGHIEEVYRPGYTLAGSVVRPAQVTVNEEE